MEPSTAPVTIIKPTIGRVVIFTAWRGEGEASGARDEYPGIIVRVPADRGPGVVDLVTFGPFSVYHNNAVPHDASGAAMTWRYPEQTRDTIEV